ncbi:HCLS1-associated protein X-1 isoform 2-T2 [Lycodopsis pacificus]
MSVFDLFRGFFGVPGGHYRGRRDPFFDAMTHDDDDDDDEEDGFSYDGDQQDPFDSSWRFGFSVGPDGMRMQEPPPPRGRVERGGGGSGENPLRDLMLKSPYNNPQGPLAGPSRGPRSDDHPSYESPDFPSSPFHGWTPFSKFNDIWKRGPHKSSEERKEDRDLDSAVSSGGLDQILTPPAGQLPNQPRARSFFQSVIVTKVVKPDGSVEERRTVRDGQGHEETTVTRSGGSGSLEGPNHPTGPVTSGGQNPFLDMRGDDSLFFKLFGGFR